MTSTTSSEKNRTLTVAEFCDRLGVDTPASAKGRVLSGLATLEKADGHHASFVQRDRYIPDAERSGAGLILARKDMKLSRTDVIYLPDLFHGVLMLLEHFHPEEPSESFLHPTAVVSERAVIGDNVHIGPQVVIEDGVRVGDNTRIEAQCYLGRGATIGSDCRFSPRVTIMHGSVIGNRVRIHSGAVIGADGFRYEATRGQLSKIPQIGIVVLEDDVEVGANATIDRAFLNETVIGARTKVDNLVQVGHNCRIGPDCILVAQVGIGGSTELGRGVMVAGQVGLADHLVIGDGVRIGGSSGVNDDIPAGQDVIGYPAIPVRDWVRFTRFYRDFPEHWKELKPLLNRKDEEQP